MVSTPQRVFWGVLAVFLWIYFFSGFYSLTTGLLSGKRLFPSTTGFVITVLFLLLVGIVAMILSWCATKEDQKRVGSAMASGKKGGFYLGIISFVGGFFGPLILDPGANQGPLLGIFFTGPLGAILGFILGFFVEFVSPKNSQVVPNIDEMSPNEGPSDSHSG